MNELLGVSLNKKMIFILDLNWEIVLVPNSAKKAIP